MIPRCKGEAQMHSDHKWTAPNRLCGQLRMAQIISLLRKRMLEVLKMSLYGLMTDLNLSINKE